MYIYEVYTIFILNWVDVLLVFEMTSQVIIVVALCCKFSLADMAIVRSEVWVCSHVYEYTWLFSKSFFTKQAWVALYFQMNAIIMLVRILFTSKHVVAYRALKEVTYLNKSSSLWLSLFKIYEIRIPCIILWRPLRSDYPIMYIFVTQVRLRLDIFRWTISEVCTQTWY